MLPRTGRQHRQFFWKKEAFKTQKMKERDSESPSGFTTHTRADITASGAPLPETVGSEDRDAWQTGHCDCTQVGLRQALWNCSPQPSNPKPRTP